MATTFTLKSQVYNTRYMYVTCEQVKNIADNTSTINWKLTVTGGNSNYYSTGATTLTIGGKQAYYKGRVSWSSATFPAAKGSVSGSVTIPHNADGKAEITVSLSTAIYVSAITTNSNKWTLDSIPRGAKITSAPNFNDENNPTLYYSNLAGNSVTSLQACITLADTNADIAYRDIGTTKSSYQFELTDAERKVLQNATLGGKNTRTVYFKIKTVIGTNTFTDKKAVTLTICNANPVLAPTVIDGGGVSTKLTGNTSTMIKGYNVLTAAVNATAKKGATITSYKITNGTNSVDTATGNFNYTYNNVFTFTATDNRGLSTTTTITVPMINYIWLTCNIGADMKLTGEETAKASITIDGNFFKGSFGATTNTLELSYRFKSGSGDYGEWKAVTAQIGNDNKYSATFDIDGLSYTENYTIQAKAVDGVNINSPITATATIFTKPVFDWGANDFNFNVPVSINGVELDYIVEQGASNGWTYRKWNSGKAECWKSLLHSTAINYAWGNMFVGTPTGRQNYPFVFAATPTETVTLLCHSVAGILMTESSGTGMNGSYATACYNIARPNAVTGSNNFTLSYYICGRWK